MDAQLEVPVLENAAKTSELAEFQDPPETPLHSLIWKEIPPGDKEECVRSRVREFFASPEVPADIKALGVLSEEMFWQLSKDLGSAHDSAAMFAGQPRFDRPVPAAIKLYPDRLALALFSKVGEEYKSLEVTTLPLIELNALTGNMALDLAQEESGLVDTLLNEDDPVVRNQAKVDLMRYLVKKRPDDIAGLSDGGGLMVGTGLAFTLDRQHAIVKLNVSEIPPTDPILGEFAELNTASRAYYNFLSHLDETDWQSMTTKKIENTLSSLPQWAQRILMGRMPSPGIESYNILRFLNKFGYKGNEAQQKSEKMFNLTGTLVAFDSFLRKKILETLQSGKSPQEVGLTHAELDQYYREQHLLLKQSKLPEDFSITSLILDKVPLEKITTK